MPYKNNLVTVHTCCCILNVVAGPNWVEEAELPVLCWFESTETLLAIVIGKKTGVVFVWTTFGAKNFVM